MKLEPGKYKLHFNSLNGQPFQVDCDCPEGGFTRLLEDVTSPVTTESCIIPLDTKEKDVVLNVSITGKKVDGEATFEFKVLQCINTGDLRLIEDSEKRIVVQQFQEIVDESFEKESLSELETIVKMIQHKGVNSGFGNVLEYAQKHRKALKKLLKKRNQANEIFRREVASRDPSLPALSKVLNDLTTLSDYYFNSIEVRINTREIETLLME
ncbi:infB, partial [Acrasis kona]